MSWIRAAVVPAGRSLPHQIRAGASPPHRARAPHRRSAMARDILSELTDRKVALDLGGASHDPTDPVGRLLFNVRAPALSGDEAHAERSVQAEWVSPDDAKGVADVWDLDLLLGVGGGLLACHDRRVGCHGMRDQLVVG